MDKNLKSGGDNNLGSASIALPGRKLATSKKPRMLKPFEIDLLQQDLKAALKVVEQDELDDARALLAEHGFPSDEFDITQQPDLSPPYASSVTGTVTLTRKSNGVNKTYEAGDGSIWLANLDTDLKSGLFDDEVTKTKTRGLRK
jgi:hypothetical protein